MNRQEIETQVRGAFTSPGPAREAALSEVRAFFDYPEAFEGPAARGRPGDPSEPRRAAPRPRTGRAMGLGSTSPPHQPGGIRRLNVRVRPGATTAADVRQRAQEFCPLAAVRPKL